MHRMLIPESEESLTEFSASGILSGSIADASTKKRGFSEESLEQKSIFKAGNNQKKKGNNLV